MDAARQFPEGCLMPLNRLPYLAGVCVAEQEDFRDQFTIFTLNKKLRPIVLRGYRHPLSDVKVTVDDGVPVLRLTDKSGFQFRKALSGDSTEDKEYFDFVLRRRQVDTLALSGKGASLYTESLVPALGQSKIGELHFGQDFNCQSIQQVLGHFNSSVLPPRAHLYTLDDVILNAQKFREISQWKSMSAASTGTLVKMFEVLREMKPEVGFKIEYTSGCGRAWMLEPQFRHLRDNEAFTSSMMLSPATRVDIRTTDKKQFVVEVVGV